MSSSAQPPPVLADDDSDSSRRIIIIAVVAVLALMLGVTLLLREPPKTPKVPQPYIASLKLGDFKMSAAENFIGATVSYLDGTIANTGDKAVTRVVVEVIFKDSMGQLAQREEVPLRVLKMTGGAYTEAVDLTASPLAPAQTQPFRLTFDSISAQWNHEIPAVRITDASVQ
jgi:hypothetical protein